MTLLYIATAGRHSRIIILSYVNRKPISFILASERGLGNTPGEVQINNGHTRTQWPRDLAIMLRVYCACLPDNADISGTADIIRDILYAYS